MNKTIDEMSLHELRDYARSLEKRLARLEAPNFVFFLLDSADDRVKIGHSKQVLKRLEVLSRDVGRELYLLGVLLGGRNEKRSLKGRFAHLAIEDEWFRYDSELAAYINENTHPLDQER